MTQVEGQLAHYQAVLTEAKIDLERYQQALSRNAIAKQQVDDQQQVVLQDEARGSESRVQGQRVRPERRRGLAGVPIEYLRIGQLRAPSPPPFKVIVDRVSFCDPFLRHVMRYWSLAGAYVLNDPFFTLVFDKLSESLLYDACSIQHPRTVLLPARNATRRRFRDGQGTGWGEIESAVGFPCILKPVDGYAWQDVFKVADAALLRGLYESFKGRQTMIVQELVEYTAYYRAFCVNASEVFIVRWTPQPFDRGEYSLPQAGELGSAEDLVREKTIQLNKALGLDFNAVEWCLAKDGTPVIIDSYNDVPDVRREKSPVAAYDWVVDRFPARACGKSLRGGSETGIVRVSEPGATG